MSWPQPTAQYGQTPSVTVAPRSRDVFAAVCGLYGWGPEVTGRLNIGTSLVDRRSAIDHRSIARVVAWSLHVAGPECVVERRPFFRGEPHRCGGHVLLEECPALRAGNRNDVVAFVQEPGECDLTRRHTLLFRNLM